MWYIFFLFFLSDYKGLDLLIVNEAAVRGQHLICMFCSPNVIWLSLHACSFGRASEGDWVILLTPVADLVFWGPKAKHRNGAPLQQVKGLGPILFLSSF